MKKDLTMFIDLCFQLVYIVSCLGCTKYYNAGIIQIHETKYDFFLLRYVLSNNPDPDDVLGSNTFPEYDYYHLSNNHEYNY
mgnify:CR=1 FL=1